MAKRSKFKITRFTNPSGQKAFRVSGSLNGKQIRRNFKTRKEAVKERDQLEIKRVNGSIHGRQMWVKISNEEHDDALTALTLLKNEGLDKSLMDSVQYLIRHYNEPKQQCQLSEAAHQYLQQRNEEFVDEIISYRQFKSIRSEINRLSAHCGDHNLADIQPQDIEDFVAKSKPSQKTWNNRRGYDRVTQTGPCDWLVWRLLLCG